MAKRQASMMQPGDMNLSPYGLIRAKAGVREVGSRRGTAEIPTVVLDVDRQIVKNNPTLLHGMAAALARAGLKN